MKALPASAARNKATTEVPGAWQCKIDHGSPREKSAQGGSGKGVAGGSSVNASDDVTLNLPKTLIAGITSPRARRG